MLTQLLNWSARVAVRLMGLAVPQWVAAHCEPATRMPKKKTRPCEWITAPILLGLALRRDVCLNTINNYVEQKD